MEKRIDSGKTVEHILNQNIKLSLSNLTGIILITFNKDTGVIENVSLKTSESDEKVVSDAMENIHESVDNGFSGGISQYIVNDVALDLQLRGVELSHFNIVNEINSMGGYEYTAFAMGLDVLQEVGMTIVKEKMTKSDYHKIIMTQADDLLESIPYFDYMDYINKLTGRNDTSIEEYLDSREDCPIEYSKSGRSRKIDNIYYLI